MGTCEPNIAQYDGLSIEHIVTGKKVTFKQLKITGFSDNVTTNWSEEQVYGRMDPITTYSNTTRAIELSFDLGPYSESDTRKGLAMAKITRLMQFQYPSYATDTEDNSLSISRPPLVRVHFANYINGLLCAMGGMSYKPSDGMSVESVPKISDSVILPQRISVSLSLKVLHEEAPGWSDSDKSWRGAELWGPGSGVIKDIESVAATAAAAVDAAGAELTAALADFGPESDEVLTAIEDLLAAEAAAE